MTFDFDRIIPRASTNALSEDGFEAYLFGGAADLRLRLPRSELISMWVADMQFAAPAAAIDAMSERLAHPIFGYTVNAGEELHAAFDSWCADRYEWRVGREAMHVSLGVIPALFALVEYLCVSGDKVLTLTPSYGYFRRATHHSGHELVTSALVRREGGYEIDFADFEAKAQDPAVTLFLFCHPHNPTGRSWSEEELRRMAEICFANGVRIISDEIHADLLRQNRRHLPLAKLYPYRIDIVTCMAVSKTFNLAGLMLAAIIIPDPALREVWRERHPPFVNPISLAAAVGAYTKGGPWLDAVRSYLDGNFATVASFVAEHLPRAKFQIPEATYLAWIDLSEYFSETVNLTRFFVEEAGVLLEGGEMFVADGGCNVRLNVACPRSVLRKALERISDAIGTIRQDVLPEER